MGGLFSEPVPPPRRPAYAYDYMDSTRTSSYNTYDSRPSYSPPVRVAARPAPEILPRYNTYDSRPSYSPPAPPVRVAARPAPEILPRSNISAIQESKQRLLKIHSPGHNTIPLHKAILRTQADGFVSSEGNDLFSTLSEQDKEYIRVKNAFKKTTQQHFSVKNIKKNNNKFVYGFYILRKEEYLILYKTVEEVIAFHGTKSANNDLICKENFNWRLHGSSRGNIFGKGVSFSPIASYASNYSDKKGGRTMLAVKILMSNSCVGSPSMVIPPFIDSSSHLRYDTSEKPDGHVIVKFNDDEFYPAYILSYRGFAIKKTQQAKASNLI